MKTRLLSAGELMRLNQLAPNQIYLQQAAQRQVELFGDVAP
jgi:hypothetical protein